MVINELYFGSELDEELERIKRELRVIKRRLEPQRPPAFRSWGEIVAVAAGFALCAASTLWSVYGLYLLAFWLRGKIR